MKERRQSSPSTWTTPRDYRVICDCQRHAIHERTLLRRAIRGAHFVSAHLHRGSIAFLLGVPLFFGAAGIPMEAMNVSLPALANRARATTAQAFPIFTTRKLRETFLHPEQAPKTLTLEFEKEQFFQAEVPFGSIIYREARKHHLAPELVAAVVESESDFQVDLVSNKNAQGLMQIVPETGRLMGLHDPFDPDANIAAGTKYLRQLLDRFGNERIALAAYNAGEGTVERLGGIPQYRETLDYLERVSSRTRTYRQRVKTRYIAAIRMNVAAVAQ